MQLYTWNQNTLNAGHVVGNAEYIENNIVDPSYGDWRLWAGTEEEIRAIASAICAQPISDSNAMFRNKEAMNVLEYLGD